MNDPFYANLQEVASDEKSHVEFLTSALKGMSTTLRSNNYILTSISSCRCLPCRRLYLQLPIHRCEQLPGSRQRSRG
jgi:hypothetical protein